MDYMGTTAQQSTQQPIEFLRLKSESRIWNTRRLVETPKRTVPFRYRYQYQCRDDDHSAILNIDISGWRQENAATSHESLDGPADQPRGDPSPSSIRIAKYPSACGCHPRASLSRNGNASISRQLHTQKGSTPLTPFFSA